MSDRTPADTRDLADRLRLIANEMTYGRTASTHSDACWQWHESCALHRAADLLDGQPQDRPATCPTCGSDDPDYCNTDGERHRFGSVISESCCTHPWHVGSSGDTR